MESLLETNIESFEVVAPTALARPQTRSKEQLSLIRHGFYAKGTY